MYSADAIVEKVSMTRAKRVLKISPPVPRRMGNTDMEGDSSVFHIKFKTDSNRNEVATEIILQLLRSGLDQSLNPLLVLVSFLPSHLFFFALWSEIKASSLLLSFFQPIFSEAMDHNSNYKRAEKENDKVAYWL